MSCSARFWLILITVGLAMPALLTSQATPAERSSAQRRQSKPLASRKIDFQRDILPIIVNRCLNCHGPKKRESGLRLTSRKDLIALNDSGKPAVVLEKSVQSELIRRITTANDDERMPPEGKRLTVAQIARLRAWINQGAQWPKASQLVGEHWAYVKPVRPSLPKVRNIAWPKNPIDEFILARLEKEGLQPSTPADRARLIRRVSLDLIGLPPTVQAVDAFVRDPRPDAYDSIVDRLLSSPRYGEHWARQWLDLARYADSNGYQADQFRTMWAYRDWVINAFNSGMPFDQFTVEQIAGDLLPAATLDQKIATGFHRTPTCNVEAGVDPEENRVNQIIDRVNTTGTVWLGTTLECAQCHNHKYDPFTQKDYYQLFAYFNSTPLEVKLTNGVTFDFYGPKLSLSLSKKQRIRLSELQQALDTLNKNLDARVAEVAKGQTDWERRVASAAKSPPEWHVLGVETFQSAGGATHTILGDKSVLIAGDNPDKDTYTVTARTDLTAITGFKIEAMLHSSLPGKGPGRQTQQSRANFIVTEFRVKAKPRDDDTQPATGVALRGAAADYAHKDFPVAHAIDGNPKTGWSIHTQYHMPHHATFLTTAPAGFESGTLLTFTIEQQYGQQRTIGRLRLSAMTGEAAAELPKPIAAILAVTAKKRNKKQQERLRQHFLGLDPQLKRMQAEQSRLKKQVEKVTPATTLVMVEMKKPRLSNIFKRGNFLTKGVQVKPGAPDALHALPKDVPQNRMGLARWLTDSANPLVARVTVNRWWAEFFGHGIVQTLEDFGTQGEPPTHPQLLDWLAVEFVEQGWSMKHIHKLIVTSAAYQQSSRVTRELIERDPYNKLYARGPRLRLSAETIRDNALAISGLLSAKMGGPPVFPPQPANVWRHVGRNAPKYATSTGDDRFRRGVYIIWRRSAPYPSFVNFDAPDRASCVVQRSKTNTPLQALTLLNDPAYIELAKSLAVRILTDDPNATVDERIAYGFRLCLARKPTTVEAGHLKNVYSAELARFEKNPKAAQTLFDPKNRPAKVNLNKLAAWFYVSNILLNLDETITKG